MSKCKFSFVEYLGHVLSSNKVQPNQKKIQEIVDAPIPKNVQQLQSYFGLINNYRRFIINMSIEMHELNRLLNKDEKFVWSIECQTSIQKKISYK